MGWTNTPDLNLHYINLGCRISPRWVKSSMGPTDRLLKSVEVLLLISMGIALLDITSINIYSISAIVRTRKNSLFNTIVSNQGSLISGGLTHLLLGAPQFALGSGHFLPACSTDSKQPQRLYGSRTMPKPASHIVPGHKELSQLWRILQCLLLY